MNRYELPFYPITSTGPGVEITFDNTSTNIALESTAINRVWAGPGSRSIRFSTKTGDDYYVAFGSSTVVTNSSDGMLMLGGTVEVIKQPRPNDTHLAVVSTTDVTVNITLGYGQ